MADCLNNEEQVTSNLDSKNQDSLNSNLDTGNAITSDIASDGVLVSNTNSGESVSSVLESGEALASQLDLPVTHTYRGAETDNIVVSVDNNAYTISASLKQIKFKTVADFPVVGSDRLLYIDATENSLYSWDFDTQSYRKLTADVGDVENYDDTELRNMIAELDNEKADRTEIPDVSNFITRVVDDLENYYTKSQSYTRSEIDEKVSAIPKFSIEAVDTLPTSNISSTTVYLLKTSSTDTDNLYQEYIYVNNTWELLGTQRVDLTNYVTTDALNTALEKYVLSTTFNYQMGLKVSKTGDEEIQGVKTFRSAPVLNHNRADTAFGANEFVPARFVNARIEEEKLVAGNNITIDGNVISADLGDGASITKLTSPAYISSLASGVYELPTGCELYLNQTSGKVNYDSSAVATLIVNTMKDTSGSGKKNFYLFAEADGQSSSTIGEGGSFIVGKVTNSSGSYHIVGTDISFVKLYDDQIVDGNKTFNKAIKYKSSLSLATSLNDKTLVDAQWVQELLASKGYLTSIPSEYVTETELNNKGYIDETELENRLANFSGGTQIIWEVWE